MPHKAYLQKAAIVPTAAAAAIPGIAVIASVVVIAAISAMAAAIGARIAIVAIVVCRLIQGLDFVYPSGAAWQPIKVVWLLFGGQL